MPYDSASGAYIRRTTTILDETPDGDTVNTAVAGKLDTTVDDSVADLNHHRVQGGHYPAPSVASASRYLKQAPSGAVSWADGVPIEQAALKDLSNVPAGTTASINITGNAATATNATSAATATSAVMAAACTGNAATASDMVAGHALAGATTIEEVRSRVVGASTTPPQFDNDLSLATSEFVQRALGSMRGVATYTADTTLTVADVGKAVCAGANNVDFVLPLSSAVPDGTSLCIKSLGVTGTTITCQPGDTLVNGYVTGTMRLKVHDSTVFVKLGTQWHTVAGSGQLSGSGSFLGLHDATGYQYIPGAGNEDRPLLMQWGTANLGGIGTTNITFPLAFPNAVAAVSVTYQDAGGSDSYERYLLSKTTTGFTVKSYNATGYTNWIAFGF